MENEKMRQEKVSSYAKKPTANFFVILNLMENEN